ncbi:hypothetical protein ACTQ5K_06450 [Niallia sp. Sow4_A1]|uniref:Uncharacterized protein n=1 Tax=Niallia hominis TaxID=3133173 RepID=A0ABV1EZQ4_9BACI|nr:MULTISPECIES: hypothetical protein [Bacillaceae]MCM3361355.1 hypothetical protein [Niallia sp. MER TA 168]CAI9395704.1 hypothetical protein BACSP_00976 [Bacillus sp. T2.9-1]
MKKGSNDIRDVVYIHLNEKERFVLSYGIEFREFYRILAETLSSVLLLKHQFEDGEFNIHTQFEYVPNTKLAKLSKEDVYGYGDFVWVDFDETEILDILEGQTIAELLYLGHKLEPLRKPFFQQLNNQYAYLAHDDGWFNKIYYKNMDSFYQLFGDVIAKKVTDLKLEKGLLGLKKKRIYPSPPNEIVMELKHYMNEGMVLSIEKASQTRLKMEIPIWILGDFDNMDDMYEEYEKNSKQKTDALLIFDKKLREWHLTKA